MAILLAVTWTLHHKFNVASIYTDCLNAIILLTLRFDSHYADNFLLRNLSYEIFKLTFCRITNVDHQNIHSSYALLNGRSSTTSTTERGTPFWTRATADLHILYLQRTFYMYIYLSYFPCKLLSHIYAYIALPKNISRTL